tara:strand:+ start:6648 stop:7145 length:498 start_codon:yes stop_codon:yes gene_type:complete
MIEERALVIDTSFDSSSFTKKVARVKVQRTSSCGSCSLKSGCGQSTLNKMSSNHCLELDVENSLDAKSGDEVLIAIPEAGLITASLRVYFIPLILMVLGAVMGGFLDSELATKSEVWTMLLSLAGLMIGFYWARLFGQKQAFHKDFLPKMTKVFIKLEPTSFSKQ